MAPKFGLGLCLLVSALACANPGMPPGGPERHTPAVITKVVPDTNATGVKVSDAMIKFDEVISERPAGSASKLGDLVLVSPRTGNVNVDWHRDNITIHPDKGWLPNTTYTVSLLPGVTDLHGNILKHGTSVTFSTGDSIAHGMIRGIVFDWLRGTPVPNAVVEAVPQADSSAIYFALADSTGHFAIRTPSAHQYMVRASANTTQDHVFDHRMAYDSTHVALADSAQVELLTFVHDSLGPRLSNVQVTDSVTLRATFAAPIDPTTPLDTTQFTLLASDSSHIPILSVRAENQDTTPGAVRDTTGHDTTVRDTTVHDTTAQDTTARARLGHALAAAPNAAANAVPKPSKPLLIQAVIITLGQPVHPKSEYRLDARNLTGPNGVTVSSDQTFTVPAPPPPPPSIKPKTRP